jgi:hypothetical protein
MTVEVRASHDDDRCLTRTPAEGELGDGVVEPVVAERRRPLEASRREERGDSATEVDREVGRTTRGVDGDGGPG